MIFHSFTLVLYLPGGSPENFGSLLTPSFFMDGYVLHAYWSPEIGEPVWEAKENNMFFNKRYKNLI